jgi:ribosomal protein L20
MRHNNITMENIFKLTYPNKEAAVADLKAKNILIEVDGIDGEKHEAYGNGVQAVVEIGLISFRARHIRRRRQRNNRTYLR